MPIRTICPHCRTVYSLADHLAGKTVRCKNCSEAIVVRAAKPGAEKTASRGDGGAREKIQAQPSQAKRPAALSDDERPRRRKRDEEREAPPIRRDRNRGLVIGLIVGGVGLVLVLGGGVLLAMLLIGGTRPADQMPLAPPDAVMVHISGVADEATREAVSDKLHALARADHINVNTTGQGDLLTALFRPVNDVQAFSQKLDFGTINSTNDRTITMTAHKVQGLPANADAVTKALYNLKSANVHKRMEAARKLKDMLPDDRRRKEVVKGLEPVLQDDEFFTRKFAIEALGIWGNKEAVPLLLQAMRDKETRDDAMKALARLKDERAAEPIAERLDDFSDLLSAVEALKQMGPAAEKAVLARLNHPDMHVRHFIFEILKVIGTKRSIPSLEKVVAENDFFAAPEAKKAIQAIKARQ